MAPLVVGFHRRAFFSGRDNRDCPSGGDGIVTSSRVVGTDCRHAGDLLLRRDLIEQVRQHRCISDTTGCHLDGTDLERLLINSDVDLAPDATLGATVLASLPFAFPFHLDPIAINQKVQTLFATVWDRHFQCLLPSAQCAEIGDRPWQSRQCQKDFHEPSCLSQWQQEKDLQGQAGLDGGVAIGTPVARLLAGNGSIDHR